MVSQQEMVTMKGYSSHDADDHWEDDDEAEEEEEESESPLTSIQRSSQNLVRFVSSLSL